MLQTVLITGANRGIGLALTARCLDNRHNVIATCRHPEQATTLQALAQTGAPLTILPLDVTDASSIAALATSLSGQILDILINNAGILSGVRDDATALTQDASQTFGTLDENGWIKVLRVNTIAPLMVTQALLPNLRKGQTRKIAMMSSKDGSITHMDSHIPIAYGTSKAALNAATKILASTLQPEGFTVVAINPGWVRTDMGTQEADLSPEESASRVTRIIETLTPEQTGQFLRHTGETVAW